MTFYYVNMNKLSLKPLLSCIVVSTIFTVSGYSQENYSEQHQIHYQLESELEGSYQIEMIGIRSKPIIDTDLLKRIKAEQKKSESASFYFKDNIRIVIKSKDEVASGSLFTQEEKVKYISL